MVYNARLHPAKTATTDQATSTPTFQHINPFCILQRQLPLIKQHLHQRSNIYHTFCTLQELPQIKQRLHPRFNMKSTWMIICIIAWALLCLPTVQGNLVCYDDWPSETGNYVGPATASRIVRSDVAEHPANESVTLTVVRENGVMQVLRNVGHGDVWNRTNEGDLVNSPDDPQRRDTQCCRYTWECYHFLLSVPHYVDGEDAEKWRCCEADFMTPKSGCPNPPDTAKWSGPVKEPPLCTFTG
jgi:hypothetical protein